MSHSVSGRIVRCALSIAFAALAASAAPKIVYVAPGGTGDGSSWESAMGNVSNAYALASAFAEEGFDSGEVWISKGRYVLSAPITMQNDVAVRGGFLGTETDASQARLENTTQISGDRANDDYWQPNGTNTATRLYVWSGTDRMTFNPPNPDGQSDYWALWRGGSGHNRDSAFSHAEGAVTNCSFTGVTFTSSYQGAIRISGSASSVGTVVSNCNFLACPAASGDNSYALTLGASSGAEVRDCLFQGGRGGGAYLSSPRGGHGTNIVAGCVFRDFYCGSALTTHDIVDSNCWRIVRCRFFRNYVSGDSSPCITVSQPSGNVTKHIDYNVEDCTFEDNLMTGELRGLIGTKNAVDMLHRFVHCDFRGNFARNAVGQSAIVVSTDHLYRKWLFQGCSFRDNRMILSGTHNSGTIYTGRSSHTFTTFLDCTFVGNTLAATNDAAPTHAATLALLNANERLSVIGCAFEGNAVSGALTNSEIAVVSGDNTKLSIANSVLHSDSAGYFPVFFGYYSGGTRGTPYIVNSFISNFDKDKVGCYSWDRCEKVSTNGPPGFASRLRRHRDAPSVALGLQPGSPFWRGGLDLRMVRTSSYAFGVFSYDPERYPGAPWRRLNPYSTTYPNETSLNEEAAAALGLTVATPLVPDALDSPRKSGKVPYGPVSYVAPSVMSVR